MDSGLRDKVYQRILNHDYDCVKELTMSIISGKYKVVILWHLGNEHPLRYGEIKRLFRSISNRMLSKQLNELEMDRIIDRVDHQTMPLHVTYSLTPLGWSLIPVINHIYQWGVDHIDYYAQIVQENVNATQHEQGNRPLQISKESELIDSEKESK